MRRALGPQKALLKTESGRGDRLLGTWNVRGQHPEALPAASREIRVSEHAAVTNFPVNVTNLIGRSANVRLLRDLISTYRVVTLTGADSIGKTAPGDRGGFDDAGTPRPTGRSVLRVTVSRD